MRSDQAPYFEQLFLAFLEERNQRNLFSLNTNKINHFGALRNYPSLLKQKCSSNLPSQPIS